MRLALYGSNVMPSVETEGKYLVPTVLRVNENGIYFLLTENTDHANLQVWI